MSDDFDIDKFLAELNADVPEIHRLGFFSDVFVDYLVEFEDVVAKLSELSETPEPFVDEFGYSWRVTDHVIDAPNSRAAWVEHKERSRGRGYEEHDYLLKARAGSDCFRWKIETVNPYFGCFVRYLAWHGDGVVMIYEDKHSTYAVTLRSRSEARRVELAGEWKIDGDRLIDGDTVYDLA